MSEYATTSPLILEPETARHNFYVPAPTLQSAKIDNPDYENNQPIVEVPSTPERQAAIRNRAHSDEVRALNGKTEQELYGREDEEGFLDRIRHDQRFGDTEEERTRSAKDYEDDIKTLMEMGLELCQAKIFMDYYVLEQRQAKKLTEQYMTAGMSSKEAKKAVRDLQRTMDESRLSLIKDGGAFTYTDYAKLLRGEDIYEGQYNDEAVSDSEVENNSQVPQNGRHKRHPSHEAVKGAPTLEEILNLKYDFVDDEFASTLEEYASLSALTERSGFKAAKNPRGVTKSKRKANIATTEKLRRTLDDKWLEKSRFMQKLLQESGVSIEEINRTSEAYHKLFVSRVAPLQESERTRQAELRRQGRYGELKGKFYDWWGRQGGGKFLSWHRIKGNIYKSAVIGVPMVPIGAIGAALLPPLGFAGLGLAGLELTRRISRGVASGLAAAHIEKNTRVATAQSERRVDDAYRFIEDHYRKQSNRDHGLVPLPSSVTGAFAEATKREVKRNRQRTIKAIGVAVVAATVSYLATDGIMHAVGTVAPHLPKKPHTPKLPTPTSVPKPPRVPVAPTPAPKPPVIPKAPVPAPKPPVIPNTPVPVTPPNRPFVVSPGEGIINEINHYAAERGRQLTAYRAFNIYRQLVERYGSNIIKLNGQGPSEYLISPGHGFTPADWGLSRPGIARWTAPAFRTLRRLVG